MLDWDFLCLVYTAVVIRKGSKELETMVIFSGARAVEEWEGK